MLRAGIKPVCHGSDSPRIFPQQLNGIFPGIALVNHDAFPRRDSKFQLLFKSGGLHGHFSFIANLRLNCVEVSGSKHCLANFCVLLLAPQTRKIEPDPPNGDNLWVFHQLFQLSEEILTFFIGATRMNPNRSIGLRIPFG